MDDGNFEAGYNPPPHTSYTRGYLHQVFPVLFHQICKSRLQSETHPSNYDEYTAAKYKTPNTRWNVSHKHLHFFPPSSNVCGQTSFSLNAWTPILPSASAAINLHTGAYQCTVFFPSSVFSSDHIEAQHLGKVIYVFFQLLCSNLVTNLLFSHFITSR